MKLSSIKYYFQNPVRLLVRIGKNTFLKKMSDERYLKMIFEEKMGYPLNLKDPKTFNEKLQWLKINDRKSLYTSLVDKYEAKRFATRIMGTDQIIPTLGVWERFEDIDFDALPDQFVLKCTHDSGGLVICRDKSKLNKEAARQKIELCMKQNYYWSGREWPYKDVKPRILAETYMDDENAAAGLTDYKFFCFNGKPQMLYVSQGLEDHATASISFYDMEGREMPFHRSDFKPIEGELTLPSNFADMRETAEKMAKAVDCPFVRIDLYSVRGKMYFSEVTFSPCGGMLPFEPKEWDAKLGEWIHLPIEGSEKKNEV